MFHCHHSCLLTGRHYRSQSGHTLDRNLADDQSHEVMSCISLDVGLVSCAVVFIQMKCFKLSVQIFFKYLFLAEHVMVNGDTEVAYMPMVRLSPTDSDKDYWTYDGRYCYVFIYVITMLEYLVIAILEYLVITLLEYLVNRCIYQILTSFR